MGAAGVGLAGAAGGVLCVELCAPLLLLCWLCCWPGDNSSDTSSTGKHPSKPVVVHETIAHKRSSDFFTRRFGSSAASLHLPSTSGQAKVPLSAHRSHEEIPNRRKSLHLLKDDDNRYHSAPSVIDEVLHRRDWEKSSKDLYIPLKPEGIGHVDSEEDSSEAPHAEPESSSIESKSNDMLNVPCKKHHTNIKSSKNKKRKEATRDDVKDTDATEIVSESNFYMGDTKPDNSMISSLLGTLKLGEDKAKPADKAKETKQSINESIKTKSSTTPDEFLTEVNTSPVGYVRMTDIDFDVGVEDFDRSGAMHHGSELHNNLTICVSGKSQSRPSVDAVGYEDATCYLVEAGSTSSFRRVRQLAAAELGADLAGVRGRHASDGDILAPAHRPESGAFSESDLDLELENAAAMAHEPPPPYQELHPPHPRYAPPPPPRRDRRETAI